MKFEKIILGKIVVLRADVGSDYFTGFAKEASDGIKFVIREYAYDVLKSKMREFGATINIDSDEIVVTVPMENAGDAMKVFVDTIRELEEDVKSIKIEEFE